MKKRIIFHIGPPKTGSSAIQHFLHAKRDELKNHGIFYPKHGVDKNGVSSGNARAICSQNSGGRLHLDISKLNKALHRFENDDSVHTLLFSSESFFRIIDDIISAIPDVHIIAFIRNPVEYQLSIYNQSVKRHGNCNTLLKVKRLNFGQWEKLITVADSISHRQCHFFSYKSAGNNGNIISDVLNVLGVNESLKVSSTAINNSYSFAALELKRWLNQFSIAAFQVEIDLYLQSLSENSEPYRLLSDNEVANYYQQLSKALTKFNDLLSSNNQELLDTSFKELLARKFVQQQCTDASVIELIKQLSRDKSSLYQALSNEIQHHNGTISNRELTDSFKITGYESLKRVLPSFFKQRFYKLKKVFNQRTIKKNIAADPCLKPPIELENVEILTQAKQTSPSAVKGGLRGKDIPLFAHHFRYGSVNQTHSVEECSTDMQDLSQRPKVQDREKGHFYYGGPIFNNFGHFIAESIHRLAPYEYLKQDVPIKRVILLPQKYLSTGFKQLPVLPHHFFDVLRYLGVDKSKVKLPAKSFVAERLWVAPQESVFRSPSSVSDAYLTFLARCEQRAGIAKSDHLPKKLYVSRTPFLLRGSFAGERYLEQFLSQIGFAIFRPEEHSLKSQLQHYKSAQQILLAEGAALHVFELMAQIKGKVAVIQRRKNTDRIFNPLLCKRCDDLHFYSDVHELPSLFVVKGSPRAAHGSALAVLNAKSLGNFIAQQTGALNFNQKAFNQQSLADIEEYYTAYASELSNSSDFGELPRRFLEHVEALKQQGIVG